MGDDYVVYLRIVHTISSANHLFDILRKSDLVKQITNVSGLGDDERKPYAKELRTGERNRKLG